MELEFCEKGSGKHCIREGVDPGSRGFWEGPGLQRGGVGGFGGWVWKQGILGEHEPRE